MTFQDFQQFVSWCKNVEEISTRTSEQGNHAIIIDDLWDTNGMIVCELMVYAYDSGFHFGPMDSDRDNGSIIIYED